MEVHVLPALDRMERRVTERAAKSICSLIRSERPDASLYMLSWESDPSEEGDEEEEEDKRCYDLFIADDYSIRTRHTRGAMSGHSREYEERSVSLLAYFQSSDPWNEEDKDPRLTLFLSRNLSDGLRESISRKMAEQMRQCPSLDYEVLIAKPGRQVIL
jgi:hypothetical protein